MDEIRRLRAELQRLQDERHAVAGRRARFRTFIAGIGLRTFAGTQLYHKTVAFWDAWSAWARSGASAGSPEPATRDFVAALLARFTRIGLVFLVFALLPMVITLVQLTVLVRQNELIVQQTELAESARRSSLVFEQSSILDEIDEELDAFPLRVQTDDTVMLRLSPRLEGRIIALSKSLRPYRYLDGPRLIPQAQSPERGQLLLTLVNSRIDLSSIMIQADFAFADLPGATIGGFLFGVDEPNGFTTVRFNGANFRDSNLTYGSFRGSDLQDASFRNARVSGVDFSSAMLASADFTNASLNNVDFTEAMLMRASFQGAEIDGASFSGSSILGVSFDGAILRKVDFTDIYVTEELSPVTLRRYADSLCRARSIAIYTMPPDLLAEMIKDEACAQIFVPNVIPPR